MVAVTVADPAWIVARMARSLARACLRYEVKGSDILPPLRLEIDARYLGKGYGHATPEGAACKIEARGQACGPVMLDPDVHSQGLLRLVLSSTSSKRSAPRRCSTGTRSRAPPWPRCSPDAPQEEALAPALQKLLR